MYTPSFFLSGGYPDPRRRPHDSRVRLERHRVCVDVHARALLLPVDAEVRVVLELQVERKEDVEGLHEVKRLVTWINWSLEYHLLVKESFGHFE